MLYLYASKIRNFLFGDIFNKQSQYIINPRDLKYIDSEKILRHFSTVISNNKLNNFFKNRNIDEILGKFYNNFDIDYNILLIRPYFCIFRLKLNINEGIEFETQKEEEEILLGQITCVFNFFFHTYIYQQYNNYLKKNVEKLRHVENLDTFKIFQRKIEQMKKLHETYNNTVDEIKVQYRCSNILWISASSLIYYFFIKKLLFITKFVSIEKYVFLSSNFTGLSIGSIKIISGLSIGILSLGFIILSLLLIKKGLHYLEYRIKNKNYIIDPIINNNVINNLKNMTYKKFLLEYESLLIHNPLNANMREEFEKQMVMRNIAEEEILKHFIINENDKQSKEFESFKEKYIEEKLKENNGIDSIYNISDNDYISVRYYIEKNNLMKNSNQNPNIIFIP
ncbi:hypothetical protein [Lyticum sinuosum]|uniref:Uncharacterized protein n=1 Tax=Lyticum sinuosum TaxID=1332059 RepID=A0AAE4VJW9_9RICK|nr:hypothetical protein [Lyticum sinuosum]MDZ5760880.1 hypothetical protein [Lyticum sinuosum]